MHTEQPISQDAQHNPDTSSKEDVRGSSSEPSEEELVIEDERSTLLESFKKVKKALKECQEEKAKNLEGWQRARAELINYKQQSLREKELRVKQAMESFILGLLSVLDSFDMAMKDSAWHTVDRKWQSGVYHIREQLVRTLEENEVVLITPQYEAFNPAIHESVQMVPTEDTKKEGKVAEVFQVGAHYRKELVRPARVSVYHIK